MRPKVFSKKGGLDNFAKMHRKITVLESLFNKFTAMEVCNFFKKTLQHKCFPLNFAKFLRTPFLFFYRTSTVAAPECMTPEYLTFIFYQKYLL